VGRRTLQDAKGAFIGKALDLMEKGIISLAADWEKVCASREGYNRRSVSRGF
jgi:hypothetical protein